MDIPNLDILNSKCKTDARAPFLVVAQPLWADYCGQIGVRGMPERDIESLGVTGWGLDAARK